MDYGKQQRNGPVGPAIEKKIVVPGGMLDAALPFCDNQMHSALEAALRWLSENPIAPNDEQVGRMWCAKNKLPFEGTDWVRWGASEWQRRMFLAPEPEVPEAVKNLLWDEEVCDAASPRWKINEQIIEAYRRGQQSR